MAGGWNKQGSGVPLAERLRAGAPTAPAADAEPAPSPGRHCWVADPVDGHAVRRAALLVEWRPQDGGWEGYVVYTAQLRSGAWVLVQEWLPAALLTPL